MKQLDGIFPWRGGPHCGPLPHEHASIALYRTKGEAGFHWCTFNRTSVQLYSVLRDPVEKFFSGVYFWKKEVAKRGLAAVQQKLLVDPGALTAEDIDALARAVNWYGVITKAGKCNKGECFSARPGPLLQFTAVLAQVDLNDHLKRDTPPAATVDRACAALRRDFRIGVAEQMDSFAVLAALDNGWPLESMCLENFHFNANRPARGSALLETLRPEVVSHLRALLAPDQRVYDCARALHAEQVAAHGPGVHEAALAHFQSEAFQGTCAARYRAFKAAVGARRRVDKEAGRPVFKGEGVFVDEGSGGGAGGGGGDVEDGVEDGGEGAADVFGSSGRCVLSKGTAEERSTR